MHRIFEDESTWNGSSWRDVGIKYCQHCRKVIPLGSKVRFSYGNIYSKRGLHHSRCANKIEKNANERMNSIYQEKLKNEQANEKKPFIIGNSPSIKTLAEAFQVSDAVIRKCLNNESNIRDKNIFEIVREIALKSGYYKDENNVLLYPGRYIIGIDPVNGEEHISYNTRPYYICLTKKSDYKKKSLGNGLYAFLYRPDHYSLYLKKEDKLNYRVSYWAKEKIYGRAIICSLEDFKNIMKGKLEPAPIPENLKALIPPRIEIRGKCNTIKREKKPRIMTEEKAIEILKRHKTRGLKTKDGRLWSDIYKQSTETRKRNRRKAK